MVDKIKELENTIKALQKEKNKKAKFSKWIVVLIVFLATIFTIAVLCVFVKVGSEPSYLIVAVFGFLATEMWSLANIKNTETKNKRKSLEAIHYNSQNNSEDNNGSEWQ